MSRTVLVIAAHPDDEALGCGGTMARHSSEGDSVSVLFLTDGVAARTAGEGATNAGQRRVAAEKAAAILGVARLEFLDFPDNAMDSVPRLEVTRAIEASADGLSPDMIYTHHPADLNVDHRVVHEAVMTCFRPQPGRAAPSIRLFEVLSSTGWASPQSAGVFVPLCWVDVSEFLERKIEALEAYAMEMRAFPHARSLEAVRALATFRGCEVGLTAAEAFDLARMIVA